MCKWKRNCFDFLFGGLLNMKEKNIFFLFVRKICGIKYLWDFRNNNIKEIGLGFLRKIIVKGNTLRFLKKEKKYQVKEKHTSDFKAHYKIFYDY